MSKPKPLRDAELVKLLLDPRRSRILEYASRPVSVNELAEKIGELPSRVYYHVHKLEEAGLLEVVDTRQRGNLIEKLYQSTHPELDFSLDLAVFGNMPSVTAQFEQMLVPGLRLIEYGARLRAERAKRAPAEEGNHPTNQGRHPANEERHPTNQGRHPDDPLVHMTVSWNDLTESEWRAKTRALNAVIDSGNEEDDAKAPPLSAPGDTSLSTSENTPMNASGDPREVTSGDLPLDSPADASGEPQSRFAFIVLSYRLEDAEKLGFFKKSNADEEDPEGERRPSRDE
ncbi:ArsR/SmtB family transcription factor [Alicyclobacillus macrosporangiidus]|uniref:Helix-turn-helix domain-containing protein n=1 Tax=Alicyclobacillus macrosporangiidus TaxID=392015 RepID=A0A1I7HYP6_9BACL|nr:winged helix-turn-helix domain-containing protein [Alicyclobacillus macrosporangiidus]SFU65741.1 Helix-turn-helix domain-containing protein [Alicyclobacillus macrosporangiidus]